ncbi:MAG TPA: hypothetical protein VL334_25795 [Anaerolineae bacterium]|nr:hypothetical protein [Anaerolineae bacterium]
MTRPQVSMLQAAAGRLLIGFLLLVAALSLAACNRNDEGTQTSELLSSYLPEDWVAVTVDNEVQGFQQVNIDGDDVDEWLYFFHYDGQGDKNGPIGGIIYDAQQDVDSQQPAAFFVPYRLLPDWREGKGQGYLGETSVALSQARIDPNSTTASADELVVKGYSAGDVLTRLSLFRWLDTGWGYAVSHFVGNAGLLLTAGSAENSLISQVAAFNRLNDRSRLCERVEYARQDSDLRFNATPPSILFCPLAADAQVGVPDVPTYPEAVVMAWLLGTDQAKREQLVLADQQAAVEQEIDGDLQRVIHIQYPGTATPVNRGDFVSEMTVQTVLETTAGQQTVQWLLVELRPNADEKTSRWRIASAQRIE